MKKQHIALRLNRSGIQAEVTPEGLIVEGRPVIHNDETGLTYYGASVFRARDLYQFIQHLQAEGFRFTRTPQEVRMIEKNSLIN